MKGNHLIKYNYIKKVLNGEVTLNNGVIKIDSFKIEKQGRDFKGYGLYNMVLNMNTEDILKMKDDILLDTINFGKEKYELGNIYIEKCTVEEPVLEIKRMSALKIGEGVGSYNITLENISDNDIKIENIYTGEFESMGPSINLGIYESYRSDEESLLKDGNSTLYKGYEIKSKEIFKMTIDFKNKNVEERNFILAPKVELLEKGIKKTICLDMYSAGNITDRATFIKEIEEKVES